MKTEKLQKSDYLTYKANLKDTRYGWLRLTPAYSYHLVSELLDKESEKNPIILDPFCGTGTTALVCAERGIECHTTDINPFLIWLAKTKTTYYSYEEILSFEKKSLTILDAMISSDSESEWLPPLHQIEKWWEKESLLKLSFAMSSINNLNTLESEKVIDLLKIAFCRTLIERANVNFGHQSMSLKKNNNLSLQLSLLNNKQDETILSWNNAISSIAKAAYSKIINKPQIILCDARNLRLTLKEDYYNCVITSPPYPNRMSYIRELRPYMYWLEYLKTPRDAGELDWQAIGGTWGCATSNLGKWEPKIEINIPFEGFNNILEKIAEKSLLLSHYVHKYFNDIVEHCEQIFTLVKSGGKIYYVVGNSKFYDVMLPVESIYASLFKKVGFINVTIQPIRKRSSKKELFEFIVFAEKP